MASTRAEGAPLSYGGRLTNATGKPVAGPVDLEFRFFHSPTGGAPVLATPVEKNGVPLDNGIFQVEVDLTPAQLHDVFPTAATDVFVQVTDATNAKPYPRQKFQLVPFAAKIPIDTATLGFDDDGKLGVKTTALGDLAVGAGSTIGLGEFAAPPPCSGADKGKIWFQGGNVAFCDGVAIQSLTTTGAGGITAGSADTLQNKSVDADHNTITNIDDDEIKANAGINATKIAPGTVTSTKFGYLANVTSDVQAQLTATTNASNLASGTVSNSLFSAYGDLTAESKIGTGAAQVAAGDHTHAGVYSPVSHDHNGVYSPVGHDHSGVYAPASHTHGDADFSAYSDLTTEGKIGIGATQVAAGNHTHTTLGTITSGTWQGTAIADAYVASAATWNAKVSSQWTTNGANVHYSGGNVGIGSATPGAALDVNGQIKIQGGVPGNGKVLTSDAAGLATWSTVTSALPRGYIDGFLLSNNGATALDVAAGTARDTTNTYDLTLNAAITNKILQAAGAWASGSGANGLFSGARANSTWYHVFVIRKTSDGSIDVGFDTSLGAVNIPSGYAAYRRLGSIRTDGSGNIRGFVQTGNTFQWKATILDVNTTTSAATAQLATLSVPPGVAVTALFSAKVGNNGAILYASSPGVNDEAGSYSAAPLGSFSVNAINHIQSLEVVTNTSSQVRIRTESSESLYVATRGWIDPRGSEGSVGATISDGLWLPSGSDVYRTSGAVGLGTTTPTAKLQIQYSGPDGVNVGKRGGAATDSFVYLGANDGASFGMIGAYKGDASGSAELAINHNGGNVGIGTTDPNVTLDVNGRIRSLGYGASSANPGLSCNDILNRGHSTGNGQYWINPRNSTAFQVHCDMTTDGGGWTIVYAGTTADNEQPMVSNTAVAGDPFSGQHLNLTNQKKVDVSQVSRESIVVRNNATWLKWSAPLFDRDLLSANKHKHYNHVTITANDGTDTWGYSGWSNFNIASGGDYVVTSSAGIDHHSTGYYHLNSSCGGNYFYSFSNPVADGDPAYRSQTLGTWAAAGGCGAAEGGALVFYAAMR